MAGPARRGSITEAAVVPGAFPRERGGDADHRA